MSEVEFAMDVAPATAWPDNVFRDALTAAMPNLRAYGRSLSGNADTADDLVQDTMARAWVARDRFIPGTNMRAWTHVILRNVYFSQRRRQRFSGECSDFDADLILAVPPQQDAHVALADLARAMLELPAEQREALLLMGAGGLTCEAAAAAAGCAVGTVKSRVARGRVALRGLLDGGHLVQARADVPKSNVSVLDQIMASAAALAAPQLVAGAVFRA